MSTSGCCPPARDSRCARTCYLLLATSYLLLATCYLLLATCFLPLTTDRIPHTEVCLLATCYLLPATCYSPQAASHTLSPAYLLPATCYLLLATHHRPHPTHRVLPTCYWLPATCYLLLTTGRIPHTESCLLATSYLLLATCYSPKAASHTPSPACLLLATCYLLLATHHRPHPTNRVLPTCYLLTLILLRATSRICCRLSPPCSCCCPHAAAQGGGTLYTGQTRLTISGCRLVLFDDPGGGAALYYASPHPSGSQSSLNNLSVASSRGWRAAILAMAKIHWICQPGYWAPPSGVGYGVGVVQDCQDEEDEQASRNPEIEAPRHRVHPAPPPPTHTFTKPAHMLGIVQACSAGFYGAEAGYIRPTCNGSCWLGHCRPDASRTRPSCRRFERHFVRLPSQSARQPRPCRCRAFPERACRSQAPSPRRPASHAGPASIMRGGALQAASRARWAALTRMPIRRRVSSARRAVRQPPTAPHSPRQPPRQIRLKPRRSFPHPWRCVWWQATARLQAPSRAWSSWAARQAHTAVPAARQLMRLAGVAPWVCKASKSARRARKHVARAPRAILRQRRAAGSAASARRALSRRRRARQRARRAIVVPPAQRGRARRW